MKTRHGNRLTTAQQEITYKGYIMVVSPINGTVSIQKDGRHISYTRGLTGEAALTEGRKIIDSLT